MNIQIVYRNYIPLYSGYCSFWLSKINGLNFIIPKTNPLLRKFYVLYRIINKLPVVNSVIAFSQKYFFREPDSDGIDLYFFTGMLPQTKIIKPFVVDFEHIRALFNFGIITEQKKEEVFKVLNDDSCKWILPWSEAAKNTLMKCYPKDFNKLTSKVKVIYPALPIYKNIYKNQIDHSIVKNNSHRKFLFIGKEFRRKGLLETLNAFLILISKHNDIEIHCVATVPINIKKQFKHKNIYFYNSSFSQEELIKKFFLTCDVFILPTHADTFGMVLLEALACGMPVITTDQFAAKEIIDDGLNGILLKSNVLPLNNTLFPKILRSDIEYSNPEQYLINTIVKRVDELCENWSKVDEMKLHSIQNFKVDGKFSIDSRNEILRKLLTTNS